MLILRAVRAEAELAGDVHAAAGMPDDDDADVPGPVGVEVLPVAGGLGQLPPGGSGDLRADQEVWAHAGDGDAA